MFRFEAEKAAREKKQHARSASLVDEFADWTRFQKAKNAVPDDAAPAALTRDAQAWHTAVVAANEPRQQLEAPQQRRQHEEAETAATAATSWEVRESSAVDLDAAATVALLKDLLNLGNNYDYVEASKALVATRGEARNSTRSLLRYAVALHEVRLHFAGAHADESTRDWPAVLEQVKAYQFGSYVASLLAAIASSWHVRSATLSKAELQRAEALDRLKAQAIEAQNSCFVAEYLHAHHVWVHSGNVVPFADLYRRSKAQPGLLPASVTSWCVYHVALHNLLLSKKPNELKKKQAREKALELMRLAQKLDEDDYGARKVASGHFVPAVRQRQ